MYFSKWHFLFCCIVLLRIITTLIKSVCTMVLKVCDEIELTLNSDVDTTFNRNEAYSSKHYGLSSTQSQTVDIVDSKVNPSNIDFGIDFPAGRRVMGRGIDRQETASKAQHHTNNILNSPGKIKRTRDQVYFKLDSSDRYKVPVSSALDGDDNTCLKTYEKKKSKRIQKNLLSPNLKDSEIILDTSNENNAERSIFSLNLPATARLRKQDCQSTNNPIKDDSFKDTHEERSYNEIEKKAQHHTNNILNSPGIIKRTRDPVYFNLDSSDPYKVLVSSTLDGFAVTSQNRNVQVKSIPQHTCNSQNVTDSFSFKSISISAENLSCTISRDERKVRKNKVTGTYLSIGPQPILSQSETSSSSTAALFQRNVNPIRNTSIQSNEKQCIKYDECYSDLHAVGKNAVECDYGLNDEQLNESDEKSIIKGNDNPKAQQHVDKTNSKLELSSPKEARNFDDNTYLKTYEKRKLKSIEKNFKSLNLKDSKVSLDTSNENNAVRSIFNSNLPVAADLRKQDCQSINNPIKDGNFKDTHEERNYNEIENTELGNGVINLKREDTNSKSFSPNINPNVPKSEEEAPLITALRVGNPKYVSYLRKVWPIFDQIENSILSLCKTHFNKSLITEDELQDIHSALKTLLDLSLMLNEFAYHLYIDVYKRETELIVSNLEHDIALSISPSLHKKALYYMEEISRKMGDNRLLVFNATPESKKLGIQVTKPKKFSKRRKGKTRK